MQLKVFRNDIIDGLQKSSGIIPAKTGAAFLRTIWLEAVDGVLRILSTDSSLEFTGQYTAKVTEAGLCGVQGKSFFELVRRLPPGEIGLTLDAASGNLLIKQGSRRYKLPVSDRNWFQNFSPFPEGAAVTWSGDFLQELIDRVAYCISDEDTMEAMACMFLKPAEAAKVEVCGLNGHQFSLVAFLNDDIHAMLPPEGILIQKKYVAELKRWLTADEIELAISQKRLFFRTQEKDETSAKVETFSLPLSYYQYPDYNTFVSKLATDGVSTLTIDRLELVDALERVAIFNTDNNRCASFLFDGPGELSLRSQGQEAGEASETLECAFTGSLDKVAFPTKDIIDILGHFHSPKVTLTLTGAEGPCGIAGEEDADSLVIIMPMKIVEETYYSEEDIA
ncbi:DNA polymerase III, beta subunit [Solidesulfovibrio carbinoliphilus subsp. oakridgensis]|uniref:Beta sliding clamp n=1 Tax=Solidesulfovibrio carbinoliphilus subsp. oakridgensis TaxID=694327 RepID=G7Q5A8_9BACT|nr:DNA polymerase III subunit beta [Solidesulfovibrio carbinoliphilus]EHJ48431.1 DNA polymerase III, beta subunit [Solidesulfovibrio carbinoliphilus subsp. oakridgensis]